MGTAEGCVKDYLKSSTGLDNCKSYCSWVGYSKSGSLLAISIFAADLFLRNSLQKPCFGPVCAPELLPPDVPPQTLPAYKTAQKHWPHNLRLQSIIRLGAHNRTPALSRPVGQDMFDDGSNICLPTRIPRELHLH